MLEHRRAFIGLRGFDYHTLYPATLNIVPPVSVIEQWEADYENMRLHMIYGESVSFEELINSIKDLNDRITELCII